MYAGLEKVRVGLGHREILGLDFHGVHTEGRLPGIDADPLRWGAAVFELRHDLLKALGGIGGQHPFLVEDQEARRGRAPDHVGLRVVLLGQKLGGHNARGVPDDLDGDLGMLLLEGFEVPGNLVVLQGGIDQDLLCPGGRGNQTKCNGKDAHPPESTKPPKFHHFPP